MVLSSVNVGKKKKKKNKIKIDRKKWKEKSTNVNKYKRNVSFFVGSSNVINNYLSIQQQKVTCSEIPEKHTQKIVEENLKEIQTNNYRVKTPSK